MKAVTLKLQDDKNQKLNYYSTTEKTENHFPEQLKLEQVSNPERAD